MTTLRQAHKKNYVTLTNELAQNHKITLRAKGMMLYLLSLPDDWKINVNHLCKVMIEGRDAIITVIKELKKFGYIHHHKEGFQEGWQYFVFETPTSEEEFKEFLRTTLNSQFTGKGNCSENPQLQNTKETLQTPNLNKNTPISPKRGLRYFLFEKRKAWAYSNQSVGQCGYSEAFEDRYVIVSGNVEQVYFYKGRDPFWENMNL